MAVGVSGHLAVTTIGSGAGALRNRLVLPTLDWCLPLEACDLKCSMALAFSGMGPLRCYTCSHSDDYLLGYNFKVDRSG